MLITTTSAPLEVHVHFEIIEKPLGEIFPFRFDRVTLNEDRLISGEGPWLNQQMSLLKEGTTLQEWESGHISEVKYDHIDVCSKDFQLTYTPVVEPGVVSFSWDERNIMSDASVCILLKESFEIDGLYQFEFPDEAKATSVSARVFTRVGKSKAYTLQTWDLVESFTGLWEDDVRLTAYEDGIFYPSNVSDRHLEMMIVESTVYLNRVPTIQVGEVIDAMDATYYQYHWEDCGIVTPGRRILTNVFPIDMDSVILVSIDEDGTIQEWTLSEDLDMEDTSDLKFEVDEALGIITLGGYKAMDLVLSETINPISDFIPFYFEEQYADFPDSGLLYVGKELIRYEEKTSHGFSGLIRDYPAAPGYGADWLRGEIIEDAAHGGTITGTVYVSYRTCPRLEFETYNSKRSTNQMSRLDVKSTNIISSEGILQISTEMPSLSSIELSCSIERISTDLFGPLYFGTDSGILTATCLDVEGARVSDIEVTLEILSGGGLLGDSVSSTSLSNSEGEVYSTYSNPVDDDTGRYAFNGISHSGSDTVVSTEEIPSSLKFEKFWLFQVLKCDPTYGTVGVRTTVSTEGCIAIHPEANTAIYVEGVFKTNEAGFIDIIKSDAVKQRFTILRSVQEKVSGRVLTKLELLEVVDGGTITGEIGWVLGPEDVEWNPEAPDGLRRIVYAWNDSAIHPRTGLSGAYCPVFPSSISGNTLVYDDKLLPVPDPEDVLVNLGSYIIFGPKEVQVRARGIDPLSGNTIYSNTIRIKILMSSAFLGVKFSENLPIPHGFSLYTEEHNNGNSIGGANFYTVNPYLNGLQQLPILGVI